MFSLTAVRCLQQELLLAQQLRMLYFLSGIARPLRTPRGYSAAATDDIRVVVHALQARNPHTWLAGVGVSLGSIILTKYLAESKDNSMLKGA